MKRPAPLLDNITPVNSGRQEGETLLQAFEREAVYFALWKCNGQIDRAASFMGETPEAMQALCEKHGQVEILRRPRLVRSAP